MENLLLQNLLMLEILLGWSDHIFKLSVAVTFFNIYAFKFKIFKNALTSFTLRLQWCQLRPVIIHLGCGETQITRYFKLPPMQLGEWSADCPSLDCWCCWLIDQQAVDAAVCKSQLGTAVLFQTRWNLKHTPGVALTIQSFSAVQRETRKNSCLRIKPPNF